MKYALIVLLTCSSLSWVQDSKNNSVQSRNIPKEVSSFFNRQGLDKRLEVSFHLKPFYLRGDFDGDGRPDIAVLVKDKATGKKGIAICTSSTQRVHLVGAGDKFGNGGDDFAWMDVWSIYAKQPVEQGAGESSTLVLKGDALLVEKSDSASGLIYWNGKRYAWYQQGD